MGRFIWLAFETPWHTIGISYSRIYRDGPFMVARLLHLDASMPSVPLYAHTVAETVRVLKKAGPQWITARFSCPMARGALKQTGFRQIGSCKALWWPGRGGFPRARCT